MLTKTGLSLGTPATGDIVSVRVKGNSNPQHYHTTSLFEVVAVNANQVALKFITEYNTGRIDFVTTALNEFFEASELYAAYLEARPLDAT
jgi:hypothetical protein